MLVTACRLLCGSDSRCGDVFLTKSCLTNFLAVPGPCGRSMRYGGFLNMASSDFGSSTSASSMTMVCEDKCRCKRGHDGMDEEGGSST
jgi:hypothetical protein